MHGLAVETRQRQVGHAQGQLDVGQQGVELAVDPHLVDVGAQVLARLALDLVGGVQQGGEAAVRGDPLGGGLGPDAGHARQVVAGLTDERGEVGVALGRDAVLLLDGRRVHPGQLGHTLLGVQDGDVAVDELQRVAVAGADQHLHAGRLGLRGQGRQDVVGLDAGQLDGADPEGVEHLLDQRHLPLERVRRGVARALVVGKPLRAERDPAGVERDRHVRGLLVAEQVRQHGREAVDGVGDLS